MKQILTSLVSGQTLERETTHQVMLRIANGECSDIQITAFLAAMQLRGITVDELLGMRDGLLETGIPVDLSSYEPLDIVGTGGDGKNTFNISTTSCFVVAGAGIKVAKHGAYAATCVSGASNCIEGLGVKLTTDAGQHQRNLEKCGFTYLHAPLFAKGMKNVAPVRRAMEIPTLFNLLGPLINPCRPKYQLLGTANLEQMRFYGSVNEKIGTTYGIISSIDGYDEISLTGDFKIKTRRREEIFSPSDLGLPVYTQSDITGGATKEDAFKIFVSVLEGSSTQAQKDVVIANSAFAINLVRPELPVMDCVAMARESIESGAALKVMKEYVALNS